MKFAYCPLIWIIHSRQTNHNRLDDRALRIVYKEHFSSFEELSKDKSVAIHERSLQLLATEIHKILNSLSPEIMKDIFKTKTHYYNTFNALEFSKRNRKVSSPTL